MLAEYNQGDFLLYLNKNEKELEKLKSKSLQTQLQQPFMDSDLGKKLFLEFEQTKSSEGVEIKYFPEKVVWDVVREVKVTINEQTYRKIQQTGSFRTKYKDSEEIKIINGFPWTS